MLILSVTFLSQTRGMASQDTEVSSVFPYQPQCKKKKVNDLSKCIICQSDRKNKKLRKPKEASILVLIEASKKRADDIFRRLSQDGFFAELASDSEIQWHSSCYANYTSSHNISYVTASHPTSNQEPPELGNSSNLLSRSSTAPTDWSKCFICKKKTYKKNKELVNVCTFDACKSIKQAAESRNDSEMMHLLRSINNDLIAAEGKYHKNCFSLYVKDSNKQKRENQEAQSSYEASFQELVKNLDSELKDDKAFYMKIDDGVLVPVLMTKDPAPISLLELNTCSAPSRNAAATVRARILVLLVQKLVLAWQMNYAEMNTTYCLT